MHDKVLAITGGVALLLLAAAFVGLFFFQPLSRKLFSLLVIGGILFDPFLGLRVESGWSTFTDDLLALLLALIFFVIYFSPLRDTFVRKR